MPSLKELRDKVTNIGEGLHSQLPGEFQSPFGFKGLGNLDPGIDAANLLMNFALQGRPDDVQNSIREKIFESINVGTKRAKSGRRGQLASLGIDPRSGLAQSELAGIERRGLEARGKAVSDLEVQEFQQRMNALMSVLGVTPRQEEPSAFEQSLSLGLNFVPLLGSGKEE